MAEIATKIPGIKDVIGALEQDKKAKEDAMKQSEPPKKVPDTKEILDKQLKAPPEKGEEAELEKSTPRLLKYQEKHKLIGPTGRIEDTPADIRLKNLQLQRTPENKQSSKQTGSKYSAKRS